MPRAPARAPSIEPAIALGLCASKTSRNSTDVDVELVGVGLDRHAEDAEQRAAGGVGVGPGLAQHPVHVHVDQPRGVVRALHVPPGPVERLRDAAEQLAVH